MDPCVICNNLTDPKRLIPIVELDRGVETYCKGCSLLKRAVNACFGHVPLIRAIMWHIDRFLCIKLLDQRMREVAILELYTEPGQNPPWPIIGPARNVPLVSWDATTIKLARMWLSDCAYQHTICRLPRSCELPTRVIDVSVNPGRLYITEKEHARYAVLSHCWGGENPIVTTTNNLEKHQTEIVFEESAKSFAHAAQVTRDLGLRYLWIDSLCIIQNDPSDWAVEAANMAQVYKNATVTISADAARGTSQGLFVDQDTRRKHQIVYQISIEADDSSEMTIYARLRSLSSQDVSNISHSSIVIADTPLSKRAWTLQERLLSTRVLHLFEEELVWCCNSVSRCQCRIDASIPLVSAFKRLDGQELRPGQLEYDLENEWPQVVNEFTARAMTKLTDRLPALSGLANLFSQQTSQDYCAGLWGPDLAFGLLWMSDHDRATGVANPIQRYPEDPRAPTWSWASVVGPVKYLARHKNQFERQNTGPALKPLLNIVGFSVHRNESMPFGSAGKGVVVVTGQVLPVVFDPDRKFLRPRNLADTDYEPRVEPHVIFDVLSEAPSGPSSTAEYFLLRAATYVKGVFSSSSRENYCILLQSAIDETKLAMAFGGMVFRRCGIVMYAFESEKVWFEDRPAEVKLCII